MATAVAQEKQDVDLCSVLRAQIDAGAVELPMLPRTAGEVIAVASAEDCDARRLADLVQHDPGLAAEMLRTANSPLFRAPSQIVSLQQAIARMGVGRVRDIALAIALKGDLFTSAGYAPVLQASWRHCVGTAAWAREIARACRINAELSYLGGLLHDIGVPVVVRLLEQRGQTDLSPAEQTLLLEELGPAAAVALIRHWGLPPLLAKVVAECRGPEVTEPTASIIATARWLDCVAEDCAIEELVAAPQLQRMNLYPDDIERLWKVRERITALVEALAL